MLETIKNFLETTGIANMAQGDTPVYKYLIMYVIIGVLFYLAVVKKFEPLLLLPIAFGMLLANLPGAELFHMDFFLEEHPDYGMILQQGGLLDLLYIGVKLGIYPSLIFMGVGAMTDFTPLIADPKSLLLGAAAQFGVFAAFTGALAIGFTSAAAAAIGIIGGADGPTAILVTKILAPQLLGAIAVAAYSYMALIPVIQPPLMRIFTTKKERLIHMERLRPVKRIEIILFPIVVTLVVSLIVPSATPLVGFLMLGNLFNVSGVTERLSKTVQNELINILFLGLVAFCLSTVGGVLLGKLMCFLTHGKVNPLIGAAGVSAVPMAARVAQTVGQKEDPTNFLLMNAMGPNVAGVIGSAVAAGVLLAQFAG